MRPIILIWAVVLASGAHAAELKLAPDLRNQDPQAAVDVIVQYRHLPTAGDHNRVAANGGRLTHELNLIRGAHYSLPVSRLGELANDPEVEHISLDHALHATGATLPSTPDYGWMTVLGVSSPIATLPWDGTGIGVAVIDSGIAGSPPDLKDTSGKNRVVFQQSLIANVNDVNDHFGHGTMVAGVIAGTGKNSSGANADYRVRGIAPNVNIINLRVLDNTGASTDSTVIAAIERAIALKNQYNIRIINLSLGRPVFESYTLDPLCQAVQQAWNAGIVVVVAAGNNGRDNSQGENGYGTVTVPGNSPYVITVGAMNTVGTLLSSDDKMTSYSSKGPTLLDHVVKPDLVAPGNRIVSIQPSGSYLLATYPNNKVAQDLYQTGTNSGPSSQYFELSGTSFAAPMVSGAAALLIQQNPALTPDQVKARLMKTATKLPQVTTVAVDPATGASYYTQNDIFTVGAGYLNVQAALANTDLLARAALSPTAVRNTANGKVTLDFGSNAAWGTNAAWGSNAAWGTNSAWGTAAIWGANVLSGTNAAWGSNAAWGTNAAWGASAIWGTSTVSGPTDVNTAESMTIFLDGDN